MKLVLFDENNEIKNVIENMNDVEIDGNNIYWENNSMRGVKLDFILLEDDVEITSIEEMLPFDKKEQFKKVDLVEENKKLKERLEATELAMIDLLDYLAKEGF